LRLKFYWSLDGGKLMVVGEGVLVVLVVVGKERTNSAQTPKLKDITTNSILKPDIYVYGNEAKS